jgi:hypothetical protein
VRFFDGARFRLSLGFRLSSIILACRKSAVSKPSKLSVDRLQQVQRFFCAASALPQRGQITGRAQLPAACLLTPGNIEAPDQQDPDLIASAIGDRQQACLDAQNLGQIPLLAGLLGDRDSLLDHLKRGIDAASLGASFSFQRQKQWEPQPGSRVSPAATPVRISPIPWSTSPSFTAAHPSRMRPQAIQCDRPCSRQSETTKPA